MLASQQKCPADDKGMAIFLQWSTITTVCVTPSNKHTENQNLGEMSERESKDILKKGKHWCAKVPKYRPIKSIVQYRPLHWATNKFIDRKCVSAKKLSIL